MLFNQKMRHTALRNVQKKVRSSGPQMRRFEDAVNSPTLMEDLLKAEKNTNGAEAHRIKNQFLPILRTCHAATPFGSSERYTVLGRCRPC